MEFYKINVRNHEMNVVFNGKMYIFFNSYCGIAAVAERITPNDKIASGQELFNIKYGNRHLLGGSLGNGGVVPFVKRFVTKCENKYIKVNVTYTEEKCDLADFYTTIEIHKHNEK